MNVLLLFFYPRDATRKRGLYYGNVCPSVRPSQPVLSKRLNLSLNFFDRLHGSSYHLSFFWPLAPIPNSKVNRFSGGVKYTGVGKLAIFDENHHLSRKFWPFRAPRKGSAAGEIFWLRLTTASAQCLRVLW